MIPYHSAILPSVVVELTLEHVKVGYAQKGFGHRRELEQLRFCLLHFVNAHSIATMR